MFKRIDRNSFAIIESCNNKRIRKIVKPLSLKLDRKACVIRRRIRLNKIIKDKMPR